MKRLGGLVAVVVAATGAVDARGQPVEEPRNFSAERFRLALDANGVLDAESAMVPGHLALDVALWFGYADDPLVVDVRGPDGTRRGELVASRLGAELVVAMAFFEWVQIGVDLPFVMYQDRPDEIEGVVGLGGLGTAGLGSPRIVPKLRLLREDQHGLSLAVMPTFVAPAAQRSDYFGQDTWRFEPELAVSGELGPVVLVGNLGYRFRQETAFADLRVDDELFVRAGVGVRFERLGGPPLGIDLTVAGATAAAEPLAAGNQDYGEVLAGVRYAVAGPLLAFAGGGVGVNRGFGTPDWRVFAGLRFVDHTTDADGDEIDDEYDACPTRPEDVDGFRDADGCPDDDNDADGIPDVADGAPMRPEDLDGHQDQDGVPDPDDDGDGVMDWDDRCPRAAGPVTTQGCPAKDTDGDGRPDHADDCPTEAEDLDGFEDGDGCPDLDDDRDGTPDAKDRCRRTPGPTANAGCPDADGDGDGVVDRLDNCPEEAGDPANQGCRKRQRVRLVEDQLEILEKVYFATGRARIQPRSYALLDNVATVLTAHPEIRRVRVEGHTDSVGRRATNLRLSEQRAQAVVRYLVQRGVEPERLVAQGVGPDQPVASNQTKTGRAANRRVEFRLVVPTDTLAP